MWRQLISKIEKTTENIDLKIQRKTVQLQKKQIKMLRERSKNHEKLIKKLMRDAGYSTAMITATILANYKSEDENDLSTKG